MTTAAMYDSTTPWRIPATASYLAIYGNGLYAASRAQVQRQYPGARIYTIDVMGADPAGCSIADVESGDMTPADVPGWVARRLQAHPNGALCRIYCNKSTWPDVQGHVGRMAAAEQAAVRYWIADPTGQAHIVGGAAATQWGWFGSFDQSEIDLPAFTGGE